jgi:hypothetical protein
MGFSNFTVGIGWSIGSILAGHLYQNGGDKVELAKRYLVDNAGVDAAGLAEMPKGEVLPFFEKTLGMDAWQTRQLLWDTYHPYTMWVIFASIGLVSLVALFFYNHVLEKADADPDHPLNTRGEKLVLMFLVPCCVLLVGATLWAPSLGLGLNAAFFMMLVFALTGRTPSAKPD